MSATRRGTSDHELVYLFEMARKRLLGVGLSHDQVQRTALALTLAVTGCYESAEQVLDATDRIMQHSRVGLEPTTT